MSNNKVMDFLVGDLDKWKKMDLVVEEVKEQFKLHPYKLMFLFLGSAGIGLFFMYGASYIQNHAQFCQVSKVGFDYSFNSNVKQEMPLNNQSYAYYLDFYNHYSMPRDISLNCSWDLRRFR